MHFQRLAVLSTLASLVVMQDINQDDIPQQCTAVCAEVVSISRRCDDTTDNDTAELDCICRAPNAATLFPTCEACVAEFDNDDPDTDDTAADLNDVYEVLTRCSFNATAYNTMSASQILNSVASSFASASGSVIVTTSGTAVLTTSVPASTRVPAQTQTGGAAPVKTAAVAIGILGFGVGFL